MTALTLEFAAVIAVAFTVAAAIGFGATLVALSLGSLFLPTDVLLARVVPLNVLLSAAVLGRARGSVDLRVLGFKVLPLMLLGFPLGLFLLVALPGHALRLCFAGFVLVLSSLELASLRRSQRADAPRHAPHPAVAAALLVLGGVAHGALATGGPPVVYVCARTLPDKATFRGTMTALWLTLNLALVGVYARRGSVTFTTLRDCLPLVPAVAAGLALGEALHGRTSERAFRIAVFSGLLFVGVVLAVRA